jgi:hypothetical protein
MIYDNVATKSETNSLVVTTVRWPEILCGILLLKTVGFFCFFLGEFQVEN